MEKAYSNNKFRSEINTWLTKALFYEMASADKSTVLYTLKREDHLGYPSLYRLFMETGDITEYKFAKEYLDGWEHWKYLTTLSWFEEHVQSWREELLLKLQSDALARIVQDAKSTTQTSVASNKYLLEKGWMPKGEKKTERGRPSKALIKQAAEDHVRSMDDLERLRLIKLPKAL